MGTSKIILELSNEEIKTNLDELTGRKISQLSDAYFNEKISKILDEKIKRVDVVKIFEEQVRKLLVEQYGEPTRYTSKWSKTINSMCIEMLKKQFKKTGIEIE